MFPQLKTIIFNLHEDSRNFYQIDKIKNHHISQNSHVSHIILQSSLSLVTFRGIYICFFFHVKYAKRVPEAHFCRQRYSRIAALLSHIFLELKSDILISFCWVRSSSNSGKKRPCCFQSALVGSLTC